MAEQKIMDVRNLLSAMNIDFDDVESIDISVDFGEASKSLKTGDVVDVKYKDDKVCNGKIKEVKGTDVILTLEF